MYEGGCENGGNWMPDSRGYCPLCRARPSPVRETPGNQDVRQPTMFASLEN